VDVRRTGWRPSTRESPQGRQILPVEVRGVRRDVSKGRPPRRAAEMAGLLNVDLLADPATVVLDEDLENPAARGEAALDGARRSPAIE
jgi:hypothetical protein